MAAYIIAEVEVTDPETYRGYRAKTPDVVARYGGRFIVRGGAAETLEGAGQPGRVVVIEFPDLAAARRFYASPEYQAIIGIRHKAATSRLILVEGHPPAS
ncbi:MAG TPA: DUF1330 domain-containing protein [Geminicoccaceae bacterium]|nr:DUF1330 domain-containing protein [Geminicoccaceae bacterium]